MKECYYTKENIKSRADDFLIKLKFLREKHEYKFFAKKAALLVIDMQDFFLDNNSHAFIPSMPAIVNKVKELQNGFLKNNLCVVQTKHRSIGDDDDLMLKWWSSVLKSDDSMGNIIRELSNEDIPVVCKAQYDAFWKTDLESHLKKHNITQLVIAGVMTHLCCETTARSAFMRGFEVFFTIDATATYNAEFHFASLLNLSHGFAIPVLSKEVLGWVDEKK